MKRRQFFKSVGAAVVAGAAVQPDKVVVIRDLVIRGTIFVQTRPGVRYVIENCTFLPAEPGR